MKPCEAKTEQQILALPQTYTEHGDFSLLLDTKVVTLSEQPNGEPALASFSLPRDTFDRFVKWYQADQKHSNPTHP